MLNISQFLIHPNLIKYYGKFELNSKNYYIIENLNYNLDTLSRSISFKHHVPLLKNIVYQILKGLNFLHQQKIIHRDLKPEYIGIKSNGLIKISDFSEYARTQKTLSSTVGCLKFQSPEVLEGKRYDQRKDIWSLGLIIYELYFKKLPFKTAKTIFETLKNMNKGLDKYYNKVSNRTPVEKELKKFLRKCLTFQQQDRFSASQLLNDTWLTEASINDKKRLLKMKTRILLISADKKVMKIN